MAKMTKVEMWERIAEILLHKKIKLVEVKDEEKESGSTTQVEHKEAKCGFGA